MSGDWQEGYDRPLLTREETLAISTAPAMGYIITQEALDDFTKILGNGYE